jgi:2,3-bisphosphoglycerate-dependent phosphoglycerate mutase
VKVPAAESLKDTIARVLPYFDAAIAPELKAGRRVIIAAHGNSLRALVKHLSALSDEAIIHEEIPTGQPLVYELADDLTAVSRRYI